MQGGNGAAIVDKREKQAIAVIVLSAITLAFAFTAWLFLVF